MPKFSRVMYGLSLALLAIVAVYVYYIFNHGELADAKNFSSLQRLEYEGRHKYSQSAVVVDLGQGAGKALGLKNLSRDNPYSWVALNHLTSDQSVAIIPASERLDVTCADVNTALRGVQVEKTVMKFLMQNCKH